MAQSLSNDEQALAAGYVLGDLTVDEEAQVAQLLSTNPAMQREVDALRVSLQLVPHGLDTVAPPDHLEDKIIAAYRTSEAIEINQSQSTSAPRSRSWARIIAALSIPALLLLVFGNLRMRQQFAQLENDNIQLQQQLAQLENDNIQLGQQIVALGDTDEVASILQRPKSRLVSLQGGDSAGTLLFTPGQWEQVVVSIADLPPLPPEQVYRMWLSLDNGEPFLCGEFTTDENGSVFVTLNPTDSIPEGVKAQEVFVTQSEASAPLEPVGDRVIVGEI
ncbi:MAG: anti-sigma factor domain-containing protein [Elainellaceae cyanobacterium]